MGELVIRNLGRALSRYFDHEVMTMNVMAIPRNSFDQSRNQYNSTAILREIVGSAPGEGSKILGVIDRDICIPILTYVFGEAQLGGVAALVSLTRLRQEFYGLKPDEHIFFERLVKESLHELGHTFGLTHCSLGECVMQTSTRVSDVDRKGSDFCRDCNEFIVREASLGG